MNGPDSEMRLGLVTDIHECVDKLREALGRFRREGVEQVVVIGDVCAMGEQLEETCALLREAKAVGVWGNHDFGVCVDPLTEVCQRYSPAVLEYMASLRPRMEIDGCYFSHIEPWLNAESLFDLWYFDYDGLVNTPQKVQRIFGAVPHRLILAGHYHQWMLVSENGMEPWQGERPISLGDGRRYFVVINALCDGCSALLDTKSLELVPLGALGT
jgi:predicted phosphodiesterase